MISKNMTLDRIEEISRLDVDWKSQEYGQLQREMWGLVLMGNQDAFGLISLLANIARTWDDLYDGDRNVCKNDLNLVFWNCLVEIPKNFFYQQHINEIVPLLGSYANLWFDANYFENQADEHSLSLSFVFRDAINDIIIQLARIIGGYDWMRAISPYVRSFCHKEPLKVYAEGFKKE